MPRSIHPDVDADADDDDGQTEAPTERTALLTPLSKTPGGSSSSSSISQRQGECLEIAAVPPAAEAAGWGSGLVAAELLLQARMSAPVIAAYALQNSLQTVSVLVAGRLGAQQLAAAAFAYMFAMSTGWLLALGGTTALDTLCSAAFTGGSSASGGQRDAHELGVLLQRAFVVLGAMYAPVAALWWHSEALFLALGQPPAIAHDSAAFLRCLIPGGLGYIYFEAVKKVLQAQGIVAGGTMVLLVTAPLSALLNYLFVHPLRLGLLGAPLATGAAYWASFAALLVYGRAAGAWRCWGGWDRRCLDPRGLRTFARLAALGVVMVGTEWVPLPRPCPAAIPQLTHRTVGL